MEIVKVLGVDPSLRNTGLAVLEYSTELSTKDMHAYAIDHCQVLINPSKYVGTDAILNMLDMMYECSLKPCYQDVDYVIVESPPIMFNKAWSGGAIASIAHISGGAVAIFGINKSRLFRPNEWNKSRKKEVTHKETQLILGHSDHWGYEERVKNEKRMEHILDAASLALWWIKKNYLEE
jgi:hypothetical protein